KLHREDTSSASPMRRLLASAWFPFLMCLVLAGVTVAAVALLHPENNDLDVRYMMPLQIASWSAGPVFALLSFIVICVLNLIRRIVRARKVGWLHPIIVLLGISPWLIISWRLLDEPRWTKLATVVLDFFARPLLWG